jgi:DNA topoisomerase I
MDFNDDKQLFIVESPSKIKKIKKILSSLFPGIEFIVTASYGHIRDLEKKELGIDVDNDFEPNYIVSPDKKNVVYELKQLGKNCKKVWLASDYDREGESIAWHLFKVMGIKKEKTHRTVFTEITPKALQNAITNPTDIDIDMFYSQQARRVIDRLIGYLITPVLWKNFHSSFEKKVSLSAGRVQTVALRIVKERDDEINKFQKNTYFKITAQFEQILEADLNENIEDKKTVNNFLQHCKNTEFIISDIKKKVSTRKPSAPFITSSLQQEASNKLGFSPKRTMSVAQRLYENGYITYMRTDSKILSDDAIKMISDVINTKYGSEYLNVTSYDKKVKGSQEAHEAIRPCDAKIEEVTDLEDDDNKLYQLIWKKTVASQMSPAKVDTLTITIEIKDIETIISEPKLYFTSKAEAVNFDGFMKLFPINDNPELLQKLKQFKKKQVISYDQIEATQKFTKPPHGYFTEASLIKKLEDLGVGRPSTYSSIISTIQDRNYVVKEDRKGEEVEMEIFCLKDNKISSSTKTSTINKEKQKMFITDIGGIISEFLTKHFIQLFDYGFTAKIETNLDDIANGKKVWHKVVKSVYQEFQPKILELKDKSEKDNYKRVLENGITVYIGKYGPVAKTDDDPPKFSPLGNFKIETINEQESESLFEFPKVLGKHKSKEVKLCNGKYGFYLKWNDKNFSALSSEISIEEACELIETPKTTISNIIKEINKDIIIKRGKYGPYMVYHGKNVKIPKSRIPKDLTLEDCKTIFENK